MLYQTEPHPVIWRRRWDSNPRALSDYRISSAARYDHFDTPPYVSSELSALNEQHIYTTIKLFICQVFFLFFSKKYEAKKYFAESEKQEAVAKLNEFATALGALEK